MVLDLAGWYDKTVKIEWEICASLCFKYIALLTEIKMFWKSVGVGSNYCPMER